ncbi:MAG: hypothetical protein LBK73_06510 [Treponema sp.]|jgi:hypothetical protein|nr:hypothetical protein [Treponema sp.]
MAKKKMFWAMLALVSASIEAQQNMQALSFGHCSELYYMDPSGITTITPSIFQDAMWVYRPDGGGMLKVTFNNGSNNMISKIVSFYFHDTEVDGLLITSRRVYYDVYESSTRESKRISRRYYAEILSDGANAIFTIYEKEDGNMIFEIKAHP